MSGVAAQGVTTGPGREGVVIATPDGERIDAWLYRPDNPVRGVLVMAMGIGGVKAAGTLPPFAEHFRSKGFASVVFDYRHWGDSSGNPRHLLLVGRQLEDYRTVLRWVRGHDELGHAPRFAWGTSFGGLHAVAAAASEPDLAGAIAQCPLVDGLATARGGLDLRRGSRLTAYAVADLLRSRFGLGPVYIPLGAPPGGVGLVHTSGRPARGRRPRSRRGRPGRLRRHAARRLAQRSHREDHSRHSASPARYPGAAHPVSHPGCGPGERHRGTRRARRPGGRPGPPTGSCSAAAAGTTTSTPADPIMTTSSESRPSSCSARPDKPTATPPR